MDILGDMLAAAVRAGDPLSAWSAAARLVRGHYPLITPSAQSGLATALVTAAERLPPGTRCSDPALPFVRFVFLNFAFIGFIFGSRHQTYWN